MSEGAVARKRDGTFARGNKASPGRPSKAAQEAYSLELKRAVSPEKLCALLQKLYELAMGDGPDRIQAARLLLERCLPIPKHVDAPTARPIMPSSINVLVLSPEELADRRRLAREAVNSAAGSDSRQLATPD